MGEEIDETKSKLDHQNDQNQLLTKRIEELQL
jgi:hypothetical protein